MKILSFFAIILGMLSPTFATDNVEEASKESTLTTGKYFTEFKDNEWYKSELITVEYRSSRSQKTSTNSFCVANIFNKDRGEIALYPKDVQPQSIDYYGGRFNDLGKNTAQYFSTLTYKYVPAKGSFPAFLIISRVDTPSAGMGKGYSQASLKYFLDDFVRKHTNIKYVISDLRNGSCQHFFPKYDFKKGIPQEINGPDVASEEMRDPFFWERSSGDKQIIAPFEGVQPIAEQ